MQPKASFPDDVGEIVATAETAGSRSIEVGDFDADGRQDVAVFTGGGGQVEVHLSAE